MDPWILAPPESGSPQRTRCWPLESRSLREEKGKVRVSRAPARTNRICALD